MRALFRAALFAATLAVTLSTPLPALAQDAQTRKSRVERSLQTAIMPENAPGYEINERLKSVGAPGITVAVINDFQTDWAAAYGLADAATGRALTPEDRHNVGSVSKTVCAVTAMRLVEQGMLSLDAPINDYLTSWQLPDNEFTEDNPVTLRHLLSHTGGTTVHGFPGYAPDAELPTIVQVLDGADPANTDPVRVNRAPGEGFRYSGGGTTIIQLAIEDVTGKPFEQAAKELVLDPLGMTRSTYVQPVTGVDIGQRAQGHAENAAFGGTEVFTAVGAAGLWSTPSDLARFLIDIMRAYRGDPGTLLTQATVRDMLTDVSSGAALGFFVDDHNGTLSFSHGGANTGFHTQAWGFPERGRGAVAIVNSDNGQVVLGDVLRAVSAEYDWPEGAWEPRRVATRALDPGEGDALAGRYQFGAYDVITIRHHQGRLTYRECYWRGRVSDLLPLANGNFLVASNRNAFNGNPELVVDRGPGGGAIQALRVVESAYTLPRLADSAVRPLEHIEAGNIDAALAAFDRLPDLDPGLMRFTSEQFWMRYQDQREPGVRVREYVARSFPMDQRSQEMLADAYVAVGRLEDAQAVRDAYAARTAALENVTELIQSGSVAEGLRAFDAVAAELPTANIYRWLLGVPEGLAGDNPEGALAVARHIQAHLPESAAAWDTLARTFWATGNHNEAIEAMDQAIAAYPFSEQSVIERRWVRDRWAGESVTLSPQEIARYTGDYGSRHLVTQDGALAYFRGENEPRELVPVGEHQFMMRGVDYFRMVFMMGPDGRAEKIVGRYSMGHHDESIRDASS